MKVSLSSRGFVLAGLMMGLFLAAIEITVVSTAMPKAVSDLGGAELYNWIFGAYILAITITGPLWGRLSDIYGRRPIYLLGVFIFIFGSALSGASQNIIQLVIFRAIQGIGGGALLTLTFTIVGEIYRLRERSRVQGYMSSVWAIASIIGPPTGGFIADNIDWRWVFYINIPFGIAATIIVAKWLKDHDKKTDGSPDIIGAALFALSTSLLLIYLTEYSTLGELGPLMLLISIASMALFFKIESSTQSPLIPLNLVRDRTISISMFANLFAGLTFFGVIAYIPILLQWVLGLTASDAGILLTPATLGWVTTSIIAARILPRLNLKPIVLASAAFLSTGMLSLVLFHTTFGVAVGGFLIGAGMGSAVAPLLIVVQTVVSSESLGIVTALQGFMRTMGGTLGVTLMWIPIRGVLGTASLESISALTSAEQVMLSSAIQQAFVIGLVAALACIPLYLMLPSLNLDERDKRRFSDV